MSHFNTKINQFFHKAKQQFAYVTPVFLLSYALTACSHPTSQHTSQTTHEVPEVIKQALADARIPASDISFVIQKVGNKYPLIDWNGNKLMHPASTMKTVTTFVGLSVFGRNHRWETKVYRQGKIDRKGVLHGNLYIKGSGDPHLLDKDLDKIIKQIRRKGIRHINGNVILDKSIFASSTFDLPPFDNNIYAAYNVGPDPLLYSFKTLEFTITPTKNGHAITFQPPLTDVTIKNELKQKNSQCQSAIYPTIKDDNGHITATFKDNISRYCGEQTTYAAVLNHDTFFEHGFLALWHTHGGTFKGQFKVGKTPSSARLVTAHYGQPLSESVYNINKLSNNSMARNLFLSIGAKLSQQPATLANSSHAIQLFLKAKHIPMPGLIIKNGSGLNHDSLITSASLANMLLIAKKQPFARDFVKSLPTVGIDGTMKNRLVDSPVRGHANIKTGTLNHVRSIAGYISAKNGQTYVIVSIINHPRAATAEKVHDLFISWVYHGLKTR